MKVYIVSKSDYGEIYIPKVYTDETQAWRAFAINVLELADGYGCDLKEEIIYLKNPTIGLEDIKAVLYDTAFAITTGEPITDTRNKYLFVEQDIEVYKDLSIFKICFDWIKINEVEVTTL